MPTVWTKRDEQVLWTLTRNLRIVTVNQAARTWWPHAESKAAAMGRLRRLRDDGLLHLVRVMAHPEISLEEPVFRWNPGDPEPPFGQIAYRLRSRWSLPLIATPVIAATSQAMKVFGGYIGDRLPRPPEATHDVHLASVYLRLIGGDKSLAWRWTSEHQLYAEGRGRHERLPDALIRPRRSGRDELLVVEFGGAYTKKKLQEFHAELSRHHYEIW